MRQEIKDKIIWHKSKTYEKESFIVFFFLVIFNPFIFLQKWLNTFLMNEDIYYLHSKKDFYRINSLIFKTIYSLIAILFICSPFLWSTIPGFFIHIIVDIIFVASGLMWLVMIWRQFSYCYKHKLREIAIEKWAINQLADQKIVKLEVKVINYYCEMFFNWHHFEKMEQSFFEWSEKKLVPVEYGNGYVVNKVQGLIVPFEQWNKHFLFLGSSGFGKTYSILGLIYSACYKYCPVIVIDGKNDNTLLNNLKAIGYKFNYDFKVWNLDNANLNHYDLFKNKTKLMLIDLVLQIFDYAEKKKNEMTNIYASQTREIVTFIIEFLLDLNRPITLKNIVQLANFNENGLKLLSLERGKVNPNDEYFIHFNQIHNPTATIHAQITKRDYWLSRFHATNKEQAKNVYNQLLELYSNLGKVVTNDNSFTIEDILKVNDKPQMVLFQMRKCDTNDLLAKIIMYDIDCYKDFNEVERNKDHKKTLVIVDEASSVFQSKEQIMMMTQQYRSKELCLGFGIQEKAGVETGLTKSGLLATLINNTTNFFIHRIREKETVEAICSVVGTKKHLMETEQTFADTIKDKQTSGQGTMRIDEEFIWHPNTIKRLGVGEIMFTTISKKLDPYTFPNYKPIVADVVESRIKVDNVVKMINNLTYKG